MAIVFRFLSFLECCFVALFYSWKLILKNHWC